MLFTVSRPEIGLFKSSSAFLLGLASEVDLSVISFLADWLKDRPFRRAAVLARPWYRFFV